MAHPVFLPQPAPLTVADIAALVQAELRDTPRGDVQIHGIATLRDAGPHHVSFYDNSRYADDLETTSAGACLVAPRSLDRVPAGTVALLARAPFLAFVELARHLNAAALRPTSGFGLTGIAVSAVIHPDARLEDDVIVDPLAVIGPGAEIGTGTVIGAGAVIGPGVRIGRHCSIGASVVIQHALIGNGVIVHPGSQIGQDGFGFVPGLRHRKVPQTGRVIVQNDVEIGSSTAIDRGSLRDTVIGEGTKIDNHVQIGHNVHIGRHCLIAGHTGFSGSSSAGDYVMLGGRVSVSNHVHIGDGARIAGMSGVARDVPPNARWGGALAKPMRDWFREVIAVEKLANTQRSGGRVAGLAEQVPGAGADRDREQD